MKALKAIILLVVLGLAVSLIIFGTNFPLKKKIEDRIVAEFTAQGLSDVKISIGTMNQKQINFSTIQFKKNEVEVEVNDLLVTATNLPYEDLLQQNYSNITADWAVKKVEVKGIPYDLPPLTGAGKYYMKDGKPVIVGEAHDEKLTHKADFTVTSVTALLENVHVLWEGTNLDADEIVYHLGEKKPTLIPLKVNDLPLTKLLAMLSSDKAGGTGTVSGRANLLIYPDGTFGLGDGKFSAGKDGLITLSPDALPGDAMQIEMARTALSNFHYENLSITLEPDKRGKVIIHLNLEGNNPAAFDGRPIKLNVNLSGDVLELLQQSILPIADPAKLIEKDTQ